MDFGKYALFFFLSTFKFLFTPLGGPKAGLTFLETYLSCVSGGIFSATIFYFASEYFMIRAHNKRKKMIADAVANGITLPQKKKFTRTNKTIVRLKNRFGIYGISLFAPLFLSVPLGTIITAKFYGKERKTFPLIILGMFVNGVILVSLTYLIAGK